VTRLTVLMVTQSSNEILALDLVLTVLALLFVGLRLYAHGLRKIPLMPDDYLVIVAMVRIATPEHTFLALTRRRFS
jgi:hypothetical protein